MTTKTAGRKGAAKKKRVPPRSARPGPTDTPFKPGNQLWMLRKTTPGPPRKYETPEELWQKCQEYFQWVHDNPLMSAEPVKFQGKSELTGVPKMRIITIEALCFFLEISIETWRNWRTSRPDLSGVIEAAEFYMKAQKLEGAAADMLNANIVARLLGLTDKGEMALTGGEGGPIQFDDKTKRDPMELAREFAFAIAKLQHEKDSGGLDK